jgi:hypothetical protein
MARQQRKMEGNDEQRRDAAREAREQGKRPSELSATLGASKQRKESPSKASHQERLERRKQGKNNQGSDDAPRPGNRDSDPKRTERWG